MLRSWLARKHSAPLKPRSEFRIGIPRVLNIWSTHQFWIALLEALGVNPRNVVFSSETSEEQGREYGRGRGAVDCCYPVKCMSGHYGELIFGQKRKIDVLLSPMIYTLPSHLHAHVVNSLSCPRVMAGPENIRGGFTKETDVFSDQGILYLAPLASLAEPLLLPKQLHPAFQRVFLDLTLAETHKAVEKGYAALSGFNRSMRDATREILATCARTDKPAILILARPYHLDPGIGHEIETDLQAYGYPIVWGQYLPLDDDLLDWMFAAEVQKGEIRSPLDIHDVWPSSYSGNTNEILWAAKFAARFPWITCVIRLTSYECGMDQPTYTPVKEIIECSGTLYFSFQDLDSTKPTGSVKIRTETIAYYLERNSPGIISTKLNCSAGVCPLINLTTSDAKLSVNNQG
jgi:predicted nucleotide-binding protein (sugar kinase/HSP70/actin superfamily)